jgi:hypothetical protein
MIADERPVSRAVAQGSHSVLPHHAVGGPFAIDQGTADLVAAGHTPRYPMLRQKRRCMPNPPMGDGRDQAPSRRQPEIRIA